MTRAEEQIIRDASVAGLDMKLEVVIPVPDVGPRQEVLRNASTVAAREQIVARGVKVSEVFRPGGPGTHFQPDGSSTRLSGPSPDHTSYRSYATSSDLDGNSSLLQELATGLPEHVEHGTGYATVYGVASALRHAAAVHGEHEQISGRTTPLTRLKPRLHLAEEAG